jgi:hypothetical protein
MDEKQIREEFEAEHQHLDLSKSTASWTSQYEHSHVEATWRGWRDCRLHMQKRITEARKTLDEVIAAIDQPKEKQQ